MDDGVFKEFQVKNVCSSIEEDDLFNSDLELHALVPNQIIYLKAYRWHSCLYIGNESKWCMCVYVCARVCAAVPAFNGVVSCPGCDLAF